MVSAAVFSHMFVLALGIAENQSYLRYVRRRRLAVNKSAGSRNIERTLYFFHVPPRQKSYVILLKCLHEGIMPVSIFKCPLCFPLQPRGKCRVCMDPLGPASVMCRAQVHLHAVFLRRPSAASLEHMMLLYIRRTADQTSLVLLQNAFHTLPHRSKVSEISRAVILGGIPCRRASCRAISISRDICAAS